MPIGIGNIDARIWKMRENSESTKFAFTHAQSFSRAQSSSSERNNQQRKGMTWSHLSGVSAKYLYFFS